MCLPEAESSILAFTQEFDTAFQHILYYVLWLLLLQLSGKYCVVKYHVYPQSLYILRIILWNAFLHIPIEKSRWYKQYTLIKSLLKTITLIIT